MSGLLVRIDTHEKVLRSVGAPPNGIIGTACPEDSTPTWVIDGHSTPPAPTGQPGVVVHSQPIEGGMPENVVPITADALVAACESHAEAHAVLALAIACMQVWLGVSIENRRYVGRADVLRDTPAHVRFISAEPLLGPLVYDTDIGMYNDCACAVSRCGHPKREGDPYTPCWSDTYEGPDLDLDGIDWLIVGGESGHGCRPMRLDWVRALIGEGQRAGAAVFVKQLGGRWAREAGLTGKGSDPQTWPADLYVREMPRALEVV